jgi:hypothetical protein
MESNLAEMFPGKKRFIHIETKLILFGEVLVGVQKGEIK